MARLGWLGGIVSALLCAASPSAMAERHTRGEYHFDVAPPPSWVVAREPAGAWPAGAGDGDTSWRNWLIDAQVDLRRGREARFLENVYQPRTTEQLGEAGKIQITFNPEYQALTLHRVAVRRDGKWLDRLRPDKITLARRESSFDQNMADGMVTALIVIDDVRVDDVVRVAYTRTGENPVLSGLVHEEFLFSWVDPILDRHARVLVDRDTAVVQRTVAGAPSARERRLPDAVEWSAHAHAVAPVASVDVTPAGTSVHALLSIAARRTWADVAAWATTLYPAPAPLPDDLVDRIATWRALPDDDARIAAALRAVQDDVRYFGTEIGVSTHRPAEPRETWESRRGDCKDKARLLVAILDALDIPARPALVSFGYAHATRDALPAATAFDHVIVQVPRRDGALWLDATMTQQRGVPRTQELVDFGFALPVAAGVDALVPVVIGEAHRGHRDVRETIVIADDGAATLRIVTRSDGAIANRTRRNVASASRDDLARQYRSYYERLFGTVTSTDPLRVDDDEAANRIVVVESYALKEPWAQTTATERALELHAETIAGMIELPQQLTRQVPLALAHPVAIEHGFTVTAPTGWRWRTEPAQVKLADDNIAYEGRVEVKGQALHVTHRFRSLRDAVPVDGVDSHIKLRRRIQDWASQRFVLEVPAVEAKRARDARLENLMRDILEESPQ